MYFNVLVIQKHQKMIIQVVLENLLRKKLT
jgi:hypothetical protein